VNLVVRTPDSVSWGLDSLVPFSRTMIPRDGKATAYVCHGTTCSEPVMTVEDLAAHLDGEKRGDIRGS